MMHLPSVAWETPPGLDELWGKGGVSKSKGLALIGEARALCPVVPTGDFHLSVYVP